MEFNFDKYLYNVDPRKVYSFTILQTLLLLIFPLLLTINLVNLHDKISLFDTIYCKKWRQF